MMPNTPAYEEWKAIRQSMEEDVLRRWGPKLPSRVKNALVQSGYRRIDDLTAALKEDYHRAAATLLRRPGFGYATINKLLSLLDITAPVTPAPVLKGKSLEPMSKDGIELTKRERQLIRRLIAGFKAVYDDDYESPLLEEMIALRDKL